MRIFLFLTLLLLVSNCSTVKVTKEIIKVKNTVTNQLKNTVTKKDEVNLEKIINSKEIEEEIETIKEKKKEEKNIVESQQKIAEINLIGKTQLIITDLLGQAQLNRVDGTVYTLRYDSKNCKLFLFFNQETKNKRVEYFELRNTKGELLNSKGSLEKCYREFKLIN